MTRSARRAVRLRPGSRPRTVDHDRSETMQAAIVAVDRQLENARASLDDARYAVLVDVLLRRVLREVDRLALGEALDVTRRAA